MGIIISDTVEVTLDVPTFAVGPEGSQLVKAFAYPAYFYNPPLEANTYQVDFFTVEFLGNDPIGAYMDQVALQAGEAGEAVIAYFVYRVPILDISIPDQFCLGDLCWTPPFAGQSVVSGYQYRLWIITKDIPPFFQAVRGSPVLLAIIIVSAIMLLLTQVVGLGGILSGKVPWSQLKEQSPIDRILDKPGDNIVRAELGLAVPLFFFGGAIAAFGFVLASMGKKSVTVTQPTPGRGTVSVTGRT